MVSLRTRRRQRALVRPGPTVHLVTLGCAKNLVDSERLLARLVRGGAVIVGRPQDAEVIVVNTCAFIEAARRESVDTILSLARWKTEGRCRRLIVMGCLGERYRADLVSALPEADRVFGIRELDDVVDSCGAARVRTTSERLLLTPRHTAYLRISDGCSNRCAYCAIPAIRGPYRSRPFADIVREAEELVASGVRELILIGQDTTLYGSDLRGRRIEDLLARLAEIRRLRWLRLLYTHPAHFSEGLIEAYASIPKLCPYVDLPVQHLDDAILRRMGRHVTRDEILALVDRIRERIPDVVIRTTIIVGFPGETREQFNDMLRLLRRLRFDHLGAFAYSREDGTRAARMGGQVSERTKERRLRDLMLAQRRLVRFNQRRWVGRQVELVVDAKGPGDSWIARTRFQSPDVDGVTYIRGGELLPGRFLRARITGFRSYDLIAEPDGTS